MLPAALTLSLAGIAVCVPVVLTAGEAERADTERESRELARAPSQELEELTELYVRRGLGPVLARTVAGRVS